MSKFKSPFMAKSPFKQRRTRMERADDLDEKSFIKDDEGGDGSRLRRRAGRLRSRQYAANRRKKKKEDKN